MSTGNLRLAFVIEAIDRASGRLNAVRQRIDKLTEPARRVRAAFRDMTQAAGLDRMRGALGSVGEAAGRLTGLVRGVATGLGVVGVAAAGAFFGIKRMADETDSIADQARRLGITTQDFQGFGLAAQMNGSSDDEMAQALAFRANNMVQARDGNKELQQWFQRVGVTMADLRNPAFKASDAIARVADTYKRVGTDGGNAERQIAASRALMGRSGDRLNQMLRMGSAAMREYVREAERLGITLSDKTVASMTDFNDEFDRTRLILFGNLSTALSGVMPRIQAVVERVGGWVMANRQLIATRLTDFMDRLEQALPAIVKSTGQVAVGIGLVAAVCDTVAQAMGGWQNVIVAISAVLAAKGVIAVISMATAVYGLAASMGVLTVASLPVLAGVAALAALAGVVYLAWEPIKKLFRSIFGGADTALAKLTNVPAPGAPSIYASEDEWARYRQGSAIQPQTAKVGGTLKVEVVGPGRVTQVQREPGSGMDIDAYSGLSMVGA